MALLACSSVLWKETEKERGTVEAAAVARSEVDVELIGNVPVAVALFAHVAVGGNPCPKAAVVESRTADRRHAVVVTEPIACVTTPALAAAPCSAHLADLTLAPNILQ
jgi:hypothetical protein